MAFDITGARNEGYTDAQIAEHLAGMHKFDIQGARAEGYDDVQIAGHLAQRSTPLAKAKDVVAPKSIMDDAQPGGDRLAAIRAGVTTDRNGRVSTVEDRAMEINVDRAVAQPGGSEIDPMAETSRFLQGNTSPRITDQEAVTRKPEQVLADSTEGATRFVENERNRVAQEEAAKKQARTDSLHILARTDTPEGMNARRILEEEGAAVSRATDQRNFASQNPITNDVGIDFRSGVAKVPGAFTGLIDIAPALIVGGRPADVLFNEIGKITGLQPADYANKLEQNYSSIRKQGMKDISAVWDDETKTWWDVTKAYANNPGVTAGNVIQSIPSMVAGGIVGRATVLGRAGLAPAAMQEAAVMAGAVGEGAMMAGQQMDTINRSVDPRMAALASLATGVMGAAVGKYSGAMASKLGIRDVDTLLAGGATNAMAMPFYKRIPAAMVQEGIIEEGMQSSMEQMLKNIAEDKPVTQGVARATVEGALAGSAMGGAVALPPGAGIAPSVPHPNAQPGSLSSAANIAAQQGIPNEAIDAAELLGTPETTDTAPPLAKAAAEPVSMSLLDGVTNGATSRPASPALDTGSATGANDNAAGSDTNGVLQHDAATGTGGLGMPGTAVEDDGAGGVSPNGSDRTRHVGNLSEVVLPDNSALPAQWEVVDADQVTATLKEGKNQPRDRSRAAANAQVQGIANMPDYRRLADSPVMDVGAPTISQDGAIVGGNGRFEGVSRAYDQGTAAEYRARLEADAVTKGIDPVTFSGMKKPVLVRRITQPFDTRALAVASNSGGSLQYSALEQAKIDGERMNGLGDIEVNDTGDVVMSGANMTNVRRALTGYNAAELGSMTDKDGLLSQEGIRRIKNALLYKAYGNSSVLSRLVESADPDLKSVMGALVRSAGSVASVRADMKDGNKPISVDIADDLLSSVEQLAKIKAQGSSVEQHLSQQGMFGNQTSAESAVILRYLSDNIRSQKRMAGFIKQYYDGLASEDHLTGSMFAAAPVTKKERLSHAITETERANPAAGQVSPISARPNAPRPDNESGAQAGQQPANAQGNAVRGGAGQQNTGVTPQNDHQWWNALTKAQREAAIAKAGLDIKPVASLNFISKPNRAAILAARAPLLTNYTQADIAKREQAAQDSTAEDQAAVDRAVEHSRNQPLSLSAQTQERNEGVTSQAGMFTPDGRASVAAEQSGKAKAQADMEAALAEAGVLARSTAGVMNVIPEADKPKWMPVLVKMFDASLRLGYYEAKDASRYVREQLSTLGKGLGKFMSKAWLDEAFKKAAARMPDGFFENQGLFEQVAQKPVVKDSLTTQSETPEEILVKQPYNVNTMGGIAEFEQTKEAAASSPENTIVRVRIEKDGLYEHEPVKTLYGAFVANGDGTATWAQARFPASKENPSDAQIMELAEAERLSNKETEAKIAEQARKNKAGLADKGIVVGLELQSPSTYVPGKKGMTTFTRAKVVAIDGHGIAEVHATLKGSGKTYVFKADAHSRLFEKLAEQTESTQAKKLEVLKAQAQGKISGDQADAMKQLADAGEHAAVDEVLKQSRKYETGKPVSLSVYHGSSHGGVSRQPSGLVFFTDDKAAARRYGKKVVQTKIELKNPKVIDYEGADDSDLIGFDIQDAEEAGHDGIIALNTDDGKQVINQFVVFKHSSSIDTSPKPVEKSAEAAHNTSDSGAELTYNKRNRMTRGIKWEDIADKNESLRVKEVTKAKVYPKPDYDALIAANTLGNEQLNKIAAHLVKQVYDSISAKPQTRTSTDEQLQEYITGVNRVMDGVMAWASNKEQVSDLIRKVSARAQNMRGGMMSISALAEQSPKALLEMIYPNGYKAYGKELQLIGGNKPYGALQPGVDSTIKAMKDIEKGWPTAQESWQRQGFAITPKENIEFSFHDDTRRDGTPYSSLSYRAKGQRSGYKTLTGTTIAEARAAAEEYRDSIGDFVLTVKNGDILGSYATEDEAIEAAREAVKREAKTDQISEKGWSVEAAERIGVAHRMEGENIDSDKLKETFGFKGVNFGNWMKGDAKSNVAERQAHLNHAYDAFLDLAEIVGVPPKAMSLNGMLGLAIGAQGSGKNLAHFVPGVNEINLTRTGGAGALAHEWGHALDHYFATLAGLGREKEPFLTVHVGRGDAEGYTNRFVDGKQVKGKAFNEELRPEVLAQFQSVVKAMTKKMSVAPTEEEAKAQTENRIAREEKNVESWLKAIRRDFESSYFAPGRTAELNEVAKQELLKAFDALAIRVRKLDVGGGKVSASSSKTIYPVIADMRDAYKKATGRTYNLDQAYGLHLNVMSLKHSKDGKYATAEHVPYLINSDYQSASLHADKETGRNYWATKLEMFARAFDAYVVDTLAEKAAKNSYLSGIEAVAPSGEERKAIGKAFDFLLAELKTKETDNGVALFSKSPTSEASGTFKAEGTQRAESFARMVLEEFAAENDAAFIHPVSDSKDLATILDEVAGAEYHGEHTLADERGETGADHRHIFTTETGAQFKVFETDAGKVWIDVLDVEPGEGGQSIYAAIANYAYNTRKVFVGDPAGVSKSAMYRRTSNMLSSALRFGTTRHLDASKEQIDGDAENGIEPLDWRGSDIDKIEALAHSFIVTTYNRAPELNDYHFDFQMGRFTDSQGRPVGDDAMAGNIPRTKRIGKATARRAVFLKSLISSASEGVGERNGVLEQVLRWGDSSSPKSLDRLFSKAAEPYATPQSVESVRQATAKLRASWHGFKQVRIVQSVKEIPSELYLRALRAAKPIAQDSEGIYDPKTRTVYLIADNLASPERAVWVAIHEVAHAGIRMLGSPVVDALNFAAKNGYVKKLAQAIAADRGETFDARTHTDEAIAELAAATITGNVDAIMERYGVKVPVGMRSNLLGMIKRVVDAVRNFIGRVTGKPVEEVSDGEVLGLIRQMKDGVEGKATASQFEPSGAAMASNAAQARFYSQLHRVMNNAPDKMFGNGKQVALWLQANSAKFEVKKAEIEAAGLVDWLNLAGKVTKADVLNFLDQNGVQVKDVTLGQDPKKGLSTTQFRNLSDAQKKIVPGYDYADPMSFVVMRGDEPLYLSDKDHPAQAIDQYIDVNAENFDAPEGSPKFASYQLPGGKSYKELLLTLPIDRNKAAAELSEKQKQFIAERNEAEKLPRGNERAMQLQSLNAQIDALARQAGSPTMGALFKSSHYDQPNILAHIRFNERTDAEGKRVLFLEEIQSDWSAAGRKNGFTQTMPDGTTRTPTGGVPNAPFVNDTKAYTALALKKMIAYAAENGFDKVAWTTGEQQAARYNLSKQVDEISAKKKSENSYWIMAIKRESGAILEENDVPLSRVEELIGKDLAKKIGEQESGVVKSYSGLDLKVGGEGMKGYYDQIVPQVANDILKKLGGGKVESIDIGNGGLSFRDKGAEYIGPEPTAADIAKVNDAANAYGRDNYSHPLTGERLNQIVNRTTNGMGIRAVQKLMGEGKTFSEAMSTDGNSSLAELFGGIMRETETQHERTQQGFTITPELRAKVVGEGMPLFSSAPKQQSIPGTTTPPAQPPRQGKMPLQGGQPGNRASWDSPEPSMFDDLVYKLQDKNIDLKRVLQAIRDTGAQVAEQWNAYLQEELFHGRAAKRVQDFVNTELKPMMVEMQAREIKLEELDAYLHARHAKEANALISQRDPNMPDGGSGMTNQEADDYFANLPDTKRNQLEATARRVDAIIAKTREYYASYGLVSRDQVDGWAQMFKYYVPLMREDHDGGMGIGQGFSIKGKEVKHRTGSTAKVVDILANIAMQREKAIVRGEKNRVAVALAGLAKLNPNPDFWTVDKVPTEHVMNEKTGLVEKRIVPMFKSRANVVVGKFKYNGNIQEIAVIFNEHDERAVRMAEAIKNLDAATLPWVLAQSAKVTRYFSSINTQYNPIFGVTNLVRDVQGATLNLTSTPLAGHQKEVLGHILSAAKGIYLDARAERKGAPATSKWAGLWEELQDSGGMTGYRDLYRTSADRAKSIEHELDPHNWVNSKWGKVFTAGGALKVPLTTAQDIASPLFDWLSDYNLMMEGSTRLAIYKTAIDHGMTKQAAASLAKNTTVNFNRKGQSGQQAGAMYAFFNAAMQGTARISETVFNMEKGDIKTLRLSKTGQKIVAGGILLGVMQALALAAAGYDDDEPPEFIRERNLIFPIGWAVGGKRYISIPMPLGFHAIPNVGRIATEYALGGFKKPADHVFRLMGVFAEAFNPMGSSGISMQTVAPTAFDPFVALEANKDWTGKTIYKEDFNSLEPTPGFTRNKDTASGWSKFLAEGINYATGGTDYTPGTFSPTADQIDYLIGQVTGGVGREASKLAQTGQAIYTGEDLPTHKMPLVGRFYGNLENQSSQGAKYYANLKEINLIEAEWSGRNKDDLPTEEYEKENPEYDLIGMAKGTDNKIHMLRRRKTKLISEGASREEIKEVEVEITEAMRELNDAVRELRATATP